MIARNLGEHKDYPQHIIFIGCQGDSYAGSGGLFSSVIAGAGLSIPAENKTTPGGRFWGAPQYTHPASYCCLKNSFKKHHNDAITKLPAICGCRRSRWNSALFPFHLELSDHQWWRAHCIPYCQQSSESYRAKFYLNGSWEAAGQLWRF